MKRLAAAVVAAALCAACGSTVQVSGQAAVGAADGLDGLSTTGGLSSPSSAATAPGAALGSTATSGGHVPGSARTAAATSSSRQTAASAAGAVSGALQPITLGFQWMDTSSGTGGIDPQGKLNLGDQVQQAKATVSYLNAHGGIAGHQVKLVTHAINYLNTFSNASAEYESTCAAFTQDAHIQVAALYTNDPELVTCLSRRGVASDSDVYVVPQSLYRQQRYFSPAQMSYERGHVGMIDALAARGFFKNGKVGIFYDTKPDYAPVLAAVKQGLAKHGIPVASTFGSALASAASGASDASSAVLQFRAAGVTHVLFIDLGGGLTYLFMNAAQSQAYTPKYALSSANNLAALAELGQPSQLANAEALGWMPGEATSEQAQGAKGWGPTGKLCYSIMTKAGVDMTNTSAAGTAILVCDMILAAAAAGEASHDASPDGFLRGVGLLGRTYQSAVTFSTVFSPTRHDGASATRFVRWGSSCSCWVVDGKGPSL